MSGTQVRVPVDREALIAAVERKSNQCKKEYEKFQQQRTKQVLEGREKVVARIEKNIADLTKTLREVKKIPETRLLQLAEFWRDRSECTAAEYEVMGSLPRYRGGDHPGYDSLLRMLRMSNKKDISLTEEQFRQYMEGCPAR